MSTLGVGVILSRSGQLGSERAIGARASTLGVGIILSDSGQLASEERVY